MFGPFVAPNFPQKTGQPSLFENPNTLGLLTLASGLLAGSGWSPQRRSIGQIVGESAMPALNVMQQARRNQIEMEDATQARRLRDLQMRRLGLDIEQDEALPGQLSRLNDVLANIDQYAQPDGGLPTQTQQTDAAPFAPFQALPSPLPMNQQLLGPWAGAGPQASQGESMVMTGPGQAQTAPIDVTDRQSQALYDSADALEMQMAKIPNMHPKAQAAWERSIKNLRDRAERLDKVAEKRSAAPKTETQVSPDGSKQRTVAWNPKTQQFDIPVGGWRPVFSPTPLVNVQTYEKSLDKNIAEYQGKQLGQAQTMARSADAFAAKVSLITDVLEGYGGGPITQFQAGIGRVLPESEYGKIASVGELVDSIRTKLATQVREEGSGATSNFEMEMYLGAIPSLITTPNGRGFIKTVANRIAEREAIAADVYTELALKGPVKMKQYRDMVRKQLGPLFTETELKRIRGTTKPNKATGSWNAEPVK